jgi:hypothetical protein
MIRPTQVGVPDTHEFAAKGAPSRSGAYATGKGISDGYPCATLINSKPSGGGRVSGGWERGTLHPSAKNPAPNAPSVKAAMKGLC